MAENPMVGLDGRNPSKPATRIFAVTPSNTVDLPVSTRAIWVGGAGAIKVTLIDDPSDHAGEVISAVPAGTLLPIAARRVYETGTDATLIKGWA